MWNSATVTFSIDSFSKGKPIKTKAGVWIDHRKAVVILMTDNGEEVRQLSSNVEKAYQPVTGPSAKQPGRPSGFVAENVAEHKLMNQLIVFYDEVLRSLQGVDSLLILGSGEAKGEFHKRLQSQRFPASSVEVETSDQLTDPQITAHVRQHFATTNNSA